MFDLYESGEISRETFVAEYKSAAKLQLDMGVITRKQYEDLMEILENY